MSVESKNISIAVIGSSIGQSGLFKSAKEMGIRTIAFSIPSKSDYSDLADKHYAVSVDDVEEIVRICKFEDISGVVSNGSDFTAWYANEIAYRLNLPCNNPAKLKKASDKNYVRKITEGIEELTPISYQLYSKRMYPKFPCIVKPQTSGGKIGLSIATDIDSYETAVQYALASCDCEILIEDFIEGLELSVETLSNNGTHYVIQTCEAETSEAPHFVEIAHHLPANISPETNFMIHRVVPRILDAIEFKNGATDIEMKIDKDGKLYLIEVNLRGAGGNITNKLISLSTGYDYLKGMIEIAIGRFNVPKNLNNDFAGDYYLCKQTVGYLAMFKQYVSDKRIVESNLSPDKFESIIQVNRNADRDGYVIYKSDHKIMPSEF